MKKGVTQVPPARPGGLLRRCSMAALAALATGSFALGATTCAWAQDTRLEQAQGAQFDVPAGTLSSALLRFGSQAGLQFNVDSRLTDGKRTPGLHGRYSVEGGLTELLAGSGLTFRFSGPRSVVIEALPDTGDARVLGPLRIEGADSGAAVNGVNGSTDATATEGTGSFTSGALGIASKTPLSIKDTPQSVSVVTHQRLVEQNITDFSSLMNHAPGITTITGGNGPLEAQFYSRGFRIQRMQLDGGAPLDIQNANWGLVPQLDMAVYDHAEILRGADGLFNGYGDPGGVISLVRKRPLDHFQAIGEAQVGSWSNYRTTFDVTGPLALDGRLRGRAVAVWQDQNFFYDTASNEKKLVYGVLDYDLTPSTLVGLGASRTWQDSVPFTSGLPRYQDGTDLGLPRATCLCFPYNRYDIDTTEVFGWLEQSFGEHWSLKANLARTKQERSWKYGTVSGTVNPITRQGAFLSQTMGDGVSTQTTADLTLAGSFELFGHRQQLMVGTNYAKADGGGMTTYTAPLSSFSNTAPVDVLNFDPNDPAYYERTSGLRSLYYPKHLTEQQGAFATLRLTFWEPLHLNLGVRYSRFKRDTEYLGYCTTAGGCTDWATGETYAQGAQWSHITFDYDTDDVSWPPTVALVYDASDTVSVYASFTDIYQEQTTSVDFSGNPLDPITGSNIEAGVKWAAGDGRLNATLALYRVEQDNIAAYAGYSPDFVYDGVHICCYNRDSDLRRLSEGVDLEVTGELLPGWQIAASYTWNDNKEEGSDSWNNGDPLQSRFPKQLFKLWSSYQFQGGDWLQRLSVGGGVNAQSRGYYRGRVCLGFDETGAICTGGNVAYDFEQGFYAVFAARAAWRIDNRWQVALNLNNLLDRRYYQTIGNTVSGNWYGEPRNFTLSLRGQF